MECIVEKSKGSPKIIWIRLNIWKKWVYESTHKSLNNKMEEERGRILDDLIECLENV